MMFSRLDSLLSAIRLEFLPELRKLGFKGNGKNFRRVRGDTINAINIQGSSTGARFYVNLGLHFAFLPASYRAELVPVGKIKEIDCEFRWRLDSPVNQNENWDYGSSDEESASIARGVLQAFLDHGERAFQRFPTAESVAEAVPIAAVKSGNWGAKPLSTTEIRFLLTLARIHRHLGNGNLAREFAVIGLSKLGSAAGLQSEFESLAQAN